MSRSFDSSLNEALCFAAKRGDNVTVLKCLKAGANINTNNGYPLYHAIQSGYFSTVRLLVENGAINVNTNRLCMIRAINNRNFEIAKYLLKNGMTINYAVIWFDENKNEEINAFLKNQIRMQKLSQKCFDA